MASKNAIPNDPGRSVVGVLVTYPAVEPRPPTDTPRRPSSPDTSSRVSSAARWRANPRPRSTRRGVLHREPGLPAHCQRERRPQRGTSSFLATFVVNSNETEILVIPDPVPYVPSV
ncbi:hypothetical protein BV898_07239 [Hypsibius exemplaris]|nr:hypothetical protein BV898_07239 [Hypsibius exemplaris]